MEKCLVVFGSINYLAVIVAGAVAMVLGAFWYSPVLFGNIWMKLVGLKESDFSKGKSGLAMTVSIMTSLIEALALAVLIVMTRTRTPQKGIYVAFFVAVIFSALMLSNLMYEQKPLKLWAIHTGYRLLYFLINGAILGAWR
jgi:uncharacterized membrane protein YwaF